ncbi:ankyrin repeat and MYND domain-containing protein 1 [Megalops cyprinoides]|uniref:ankyrin repeat and MYND domain-containing protein 1 n=1 Tax=Megalops cyprinoides TaxID=118141 RepID=UPI0018643492|nr:ankyrin repeat and MYND domain-containing protein 1 [Megalops cyprinoides]
MPTSEGVTASAKFPNFLEGAVNIGQRTIDSRVGYTGGTGRGGKKHGAGVQEWPDGSRYVGEFVNGLKHGKGVFTWANGEFYDGSFYKDYRHGNGTYSWPGGSRFTGKFYRNRKEGYGTQHLADGTVFQGLYRADERFGPGVATYPDGRQDVGLWHRERLWKLCTRVGGAFSLSAVPGYAAWVTPGRKAGSGGPADPSVLPHRERPEAAPFVLPPGMETYSTDSDHLPLPHCTRKELDQHFFQGRGCDPDVDPPVSGCLPLQRRMQAHIHRHRFEAEAQDWDVAAVLSGDRERFGLKGPLELTSECLILAASRGDLQSMHGILKEGAVHPDVGDTTGHTALVAASMNCHNDVIHLLLDCGADVNKLTGQGMSALAVCSVLYYPFASLHKTVAERALHETLPGSQDCETQPPLGSSPQESTVEAEAKWSTAQNEETDPTNPADPTGIITGRVNCKPSSTSGPEVRSIQVLDGQIQVGSVAWPESGGRLEEEFSTTGDSAFDSALSQASLRVWVTENALQQTAEALSRASLAWPADTQETVRKMAHMKTEHRARWATMKLLLGRGGDPNTSCVPMPILFLAVKARHVQAVRHLLECGARTDVPLPPEEKGLYPLHIAAGLPGPEGPRITELLLHALADPDVRARDADEVFELDEVTAGNFVNAVTGEPGHQEPPEEGGRTPLHVACQRDTDHAVARDVVSLLLSHKSNTNLLWSGHSALSLAIASGNDLAVDELLAWGADPNLPLTRHVGSALCAVANINYNCRQHPQSRIKLLEKLIKAGANILMPVVYGEGRRSAVGTAVDYAYYAFQQDARIAHTPYHALSSKEREVYNARRLLLAQMGDLLRRAAVGAERQRLEREQSLGVRSESVVSVPWKSSCISEQVPPLQGKPLFRYCYQCGRSAGVTLAPCSRCREVFYCGKACKMKAWNDRHKDECIRVSASKESSKRQELHTQERQGQDGRRTPAGKRGNRRKGTDSCVDTGGHARSALFKGSVKQRRALKQEAALDKFISAWAVPAVGLVFLGA